MNLKGSLFWDIRYSSGKSSAFLKEIGGGGGGPYIFHKNRENVELKPEMERSFNDFN